jgi:hypothetical protein
VFRGCRFIAALVLLGEWPSWLPEAKSHPPVVGLAPKRGARLDGVDEDVAMNAAGATACGARARRSR